MKNTNIHIQTNHFTLEFSKSENPQVKAVSKNKYQFRHNRKQKDKHMI